MKRILFEFSQLIEFSIFIRNLKYNKTLLNFNSKKFIILACNSERLVESYLRSLTFKLPEKIEVNVEFYDFTDLLFFYIEKDEPWVNLVNCDLENSSNDTFFFRLNQFLKNKRHQYINDSNCIYKFNDVRFRNLSFFLYILMNCSEYDSFISFLKCNLLNNNSNIFQFKYSLKNSNTVFQDLDLIYEDFRLPNKLAYFLPNLISSSSFKSESLYIFINSNYFLIDKSNQNERKKYRQFCFLDETTNQTFIFLYYETNNKVYIKIRDSYYETFKTTHYLVYLAHSFELNDRIFLTEDKVTFLELKRIVVHSLEINPTNIVEYPVKIENEVYLATSYNEAINAIFFTEYDLKLHKIVYKCNFGNENRVNDESQSNLVEDKFYNITFTMITLFEPPSQLFSFEYCVLLNKNSILDFKNNTAKKFLTLNRPEDLKLTSNLFKDSYLDNDENICSFKRLVNFEVKQIKLSVEQQTERVKLFFKNIFNVNLPTNIINQINGANHIKISYPECTILHNNFFLKEINFSLHLALSDPIASFNKIINGKNIIFSLFFLDIYIEDFSCQNICSATITRFSIDYVLQNNFDIISYQINPNQVQKYKYSKLIAREHLKKINLSTLIKIKSSIVKNLSFDILSDSETIEDLIEFKITI